MGVTHRRPRHFGNVMRYNASVPIVNERCEIVGWTDEAPVVKGSLLSHDLAERLVGPITGLYVQIEDHKAAVLPGAPPDWSGPWRCLALCSNRVTPVALTQASLLPTTAVIVKAPAN